MYTLAAEKGVNHFIVPGNKPVVIKQYHKLLSKIVKEPEYCMPGIGKQGGDIKSSFDTLEGAPAYAIIGASIYEHADMADAARRFCAEALSITGREYEE
jgi:orotidine-5'-phosphate decarboxylase